MSIRRPMQWKCLLWGVTLISAANLGGKILAAQAAEKTKAVIDAKGADLRPVFEEWTLPPRLQGERGTCSVFTMIGAMEYALAKRKGKGIRLSVEYLNWAKNATIDASQDGGKFIDLWKGFSENGICPEAAMPYRPKYESENKPSAEAKEFARKFSADNLHVHWIKQWDPNTGLTEEQFEEIKQTLHKEWPVCGGFRWPVTAQWKDGVLEMPPPGRVFDGHSVLLVGYREDPKLPGGGAFLLRNSNTDRDDGFMCYEYARAYSNDALWIESDKNPANSAKK
jgi:hypothetical protein